MLATVKSEKTQIFLSPLFVLSPLCAAPSQTDCNKGALIVRANKGSQNGDCYNYNMQNTRSLRLRPFGSINNPSHGNFPLKGYPGASADEIFPES